MENDTLGAALEREHREIDAGIEAFTSGLAAGESQTESLTRAMEGLRRHIYLEEEFLFPPLRAAGMMAPIFVMLREHGEMWKTLDKLDAELSRGTAGAAVAEVCRELEVQLETHNSKEEPILYPQADTVLTASASADLRAFLESGRTPEAWVCAGARA
jgi:regulator of cell morphogenesis and NO signaling